MHTIGYEIATYILNADELSSCPTEEYPYFICKALILLYGQTVADNTASGSVCVRW